MLCKTADGTPAALRDRCCHRTAKLSKGFVEHGNIVCGYHGWTYNAAGACVRIPQSPTAPSRPAPRCRPTTAQERYGYAWVALDDPLRPIPDFPEDGDPGYRRIFQFYEEWKTSPLRVMENSFDNSHFSFVHKANFGMIDQPKPAELRIPTRPTTASRPRRWCRSTTRRPSHRITGTTEPITDRHLLNRYYLPFSRRFGCRYPASGIDHIIYNCATPIDDDRMMLVQWLYRNDTEEDCSTQELIDWDAAITAEDRDILEATDCRCLHRHAPPGRNSTWSPTSPAC